MVLAEVPSFVADVGVIAGVIVAFSGATGVLLRGIRSGIRELDERIERHVEPLQGTLHSIDKRLAKVEAEVSPNGGSSMKDQLTRVDKATRPEATE